MDKYTWLDIGSSYLSGEVIAAFLWAQLEEADAISARRSALWRHYDAAFEPLACGVRALGMWRAGTAAGHPGEL